MSKRQRQDSNPEPLLATGEEEAQHSGKYTHLDTWPTPNTRQTIRCILPPHEPLGFDTYDDYEVHYHKQHVNRCLECGKNLPTEHFLSLHIAENHDPLTATKRDRGDKTYHCFVHDCEKVCSTWQKRRMHLVDKHMFPKNFDFLIVNHGLDKRFSLLRPDATNRPKDKPSHTQQSKAGVTPSSEATAISQTAHHVIEDEADTEATDADKPAKDVSMDDIADSMAALKFVPTSVTFGRGRQRRGLAKD